MKFFFILVLHLSVIGCSEYSYQQTERLFNEENLIAKLESCSGVSFDTSRRAVPALVYGVEVYSEEENYKALLFPHSELNLYAEQRFLTLGPKDTFMGLDIYTDQYAITIFNVNRKIEIVHSMSSDTSLNQVGINAFVSPPSVAKRSCLRCVEHNSKISQVTVWWEYEANIGKKLSAITVGCL